MPQCFTPAALQLLRKCIQNLVGLRHYQMKIMAEGLDAESPFNKNDASSYSCKYVSSKVHHYLYSAFEALCFSCGCFTRSDIGIKANNITKIISYFNHLRLNRIL